MTGVRPDLTIGAVFVYFHSSWSTVGNPSASNRSNDCSRNCRSQLGSFDRWVDAARKALPNMFSSTNTADMTLLAPRAFPVAALQPVVTLLFQFEREFLTAFFHDSSAREHMHKIRNDVVEQALIVRDDDRCLLRTVKFVDPLGDNPQ